MRERHQKSQAGNQKGASAHGRYAIVSQVDKQWPALATRTNDLSIMSPSGQIEGEEIRRLSRGKSNYLMPTYRDS
jgi:hypothetical protein